MPGVHSCFMRSRQSGSDRLRPMAERVIDHLQIVEIDQHQGPVAVPPRDLGNDLVEPAAVRRPVSPSVSAMRRRSAMRWSRFHGNGAEMHAGIDDLPFGVRWPTDVAIVEGEGADIFPEPMIGVDQQAFSPKRQSKLLVGLPVFMGIDVLDENRFPVKAAVPTGADTMADRDGRRLRMCIRAEEKGRRGAQALLLVEQQDGTDEIVRHGLHFATEIIDVSASDCPVAIFSRMVFCKGRSMGPAIVWLSQSRSERP